LLACALFDDDLVKGRVVWVERIVSGLLMVGWGWLVGRRQTFRIREDKERCLTESLRGGELNLKRGREA
jgi:hypothetical protein